MYYTSILITLSKKQKRKKIHNI